MGNETFCLQVENVSFSSLPSVPVLKHLDLSLAKGTHAALLGESGAGKTTLLYLLLGLWEPDEGRILLYGKDAREFGREELSASVLAATATNHIFNLSIRENFRLLHPDISDEKIWECLSVCQLRELAESLPDHLDTGLGEDARKLSGGEKKRLQLALALAGETSLLLLDEPTANLDRQTARNLMDALLHHREGRTLLVITHDLPLAERMGRVWRLGEC